jgi:hypothetical protein
MVILRHSKSFSICNLNIVFVIMYMEFIPDDVKVVSLDCMSRVGLPQDITRMIMGYINTTCSVPFHNKSVNRLDERIRVSTRVDMYMSPLPNRSLPTVLYQDEFDILKRRYAVPGIYPVRAFVTSKGKTKIHTFTTSAINAMEASRRMRSTPGGCI